MKIIEQQGNILDHVGKDYIAHAISGDFTLGAGIAKKINEKFKEVFPNSPHDTLSEALKHEFTTPQTLNATHEACTYLIENIFSVCVKGNYKDTVDSFNLYIALEELATLCDENDVKTLYMPKICSGREKLEWSKVKCLIEDAFTDYDIEIIVLDYKEEKHSDGVSSRRKYELYNEMLNYISEIIDDEKELKLQTLKNIDEENNGDRVKGLLSNLLENEKRYQEKLLLEKKRREEEKRERERLEEIEYEGFGIDDNDESDDSECDCYNEEDNEEAFVYQ